MDTASLAQSALLPKATRERVMRGVALAGNVEAHGDLYTVEASGGGYWYTVNLDGETCSCRDYRRREDACKHVYAATLVAAKSRGGVA